MRPIQDRDNLGYAEQQAFRYRRENEIERQRKKQEAANWASRIGTSLSSLRAEAIGINSIDEMNAKVLLEAKSRLADAWQRRKENPDNLDAIMEIANLERLPEDLATYQKQYANWASQIANGINNGNLSAGLNKKLIDKISSHVGDLNAVYKLDEKGSLVGAMVDPDNDDIMEFKTLRSILDGSGLERPIPVADYNASQEAIKKMYSTHTNVTDEDGKRIETKGLRQGDIDGIRASVENVWGTYQEPTDFAKSVLADRLNLREDQVTEELFEQYKKDFGDEIIASYSTTNKEDDGYDKRQQRALQWARLNKDRRDKRKNEADFLRTTIDGALAGDSKYVQAITDSLTEAGKEEDNPVSKAEFKNGKLILQMKDGAIEELDAADRSSVGRLLSFVRPDDTPDVRMGLYSMGEVVEDGFVTQEETGNSELKIESLVDGLPDDEDDAVAELNEILPNQFKAEGNFFTKMVGNKIQGPDGETYNMNTQAGRNKLKAFLKDFDFEASQESEEDRINRLLAEAE